MNIAVSFEKDSATNIYEALINRFQTAETAVYGNNLTHFFPRGPRDFNKYDRLDNALRHPDLIIVLYSREYYKRDWLRSEMDAFLQLEDYRKEKNLVLIIPTGDIELSEIPSWYHEWINPSIKFTTGDEKEMEALATHISEVSREKLESAKPTRPNKVFIVHGHDHESKAELEIFLREIGLEPVVLHREADEGLTIIEKFEKHSSVGYALILLTPDDVVQSSATGDDTKEVLEYRARQNVIFEFGFFIGKLGRSRVCCIYRRSVTPPSDISGLVYKQYKEHINEIKYELVKELRKAGYEVS
jgi:predicted nucleotide-binding protein